MPADPNLIFDRTFRVETTKELITRKTDEETGFKEESHKHTYPLLDTGRGKEAMMKILWPEDLKLDDLDHVQVTVRKVSGQAKLPSNSPSAQAHANGTGKGKEKDPSVVAKKRGQKAPEVDAPINVTT